MEFFFLVLMFVIVCVVVMPTSHRLRHPNVSPVRDYG